MDVRKELEDRGCIYSGHFVGTSGYHLSGYCNLDPIMPHASLVGELTKLLVEKFTKSDVQTVAVPAVGAIPLAHWGAMHLTEMTGRKVFGVWADKINPKGFAFEREGFIKAVKGKNVLILEDMINRMYSARKIIEVVREAGGTVVGVGSFAANKGVSAKAMDAPKFVKLCSVEYDAWSPEDCARKGLCFKKKPIVEDIGHGDDYKEVHPEYAGGYTKLLSLSTVSNT